MVESPLHSFLKKLGIAFLINQDCFLVDTEVPITMFGQRRLHHLDGHHVIDVCGVGERFFRADQKMMKRKIDKNYEIKQNILRGIEVKVSRSDLKNGFICSGCNYNYLLTPYNLISPSILPKGVGLIEYNKYKFSMKLTGEEKFSFKGLKVTKKPYFKKIYHYQLDNAVAHMARQKVTTNLKEMFMELVIEKSKFNYHVNC